LLLTVSGLAKVAIITTNAYAANRIAAFYKPLLWDGGLVLYIFHYGFTNFIASELIPSQ
jgi:hypothetical protein